MFAKYMPQAGTMWLLLLESAFDSKGSSWVLNNLGPVTI